MNALLITAVFLVVVFFATWRFGVRVGNLSVVDAVWSIAFAPVVLIYFYFGEGWIYRRGAIAVIVVAWSLRLGIHLTIRIAAHHPKEDPRYEILREKWTGKFSFLYFFEAQALLVWLLMLPVFLICKNPTTGFSAVEIVGFSLWVLGLIGEGIADWQLKRFKANSETSDSICQEGLWKYSRHPNYFFQSLLWWGQFLAALPAPYGWWAILAPLAMLYALLRITGIPLTEELSLKKRGNSYRAYQKKTSPFIPLPPRN